MRIHTLIFIILLLLQSTAVVAHGEDQATDSVGFTIERFDIIGNTLLEPSKIENVLKSYIGDNKTAQDVEKARADLERYYHKAGYPTALVNIPEQVVEGGSVQLQVIESTIRRVRITGNRYFTMESIRKKLPSFQAGEILYLPRIQEELSRINSNPDLKVAPILKPGKELGTIDVDLKVKDKLPLHGSLELNNRSAYGTTDLRLNGVLRYDNLWQKEHSISLQYQTSPEDTSEVTALAASYVLSAPWNSNHILAIYSVWSDSNVAFGEGFETVGTGYIVGARNVIPFPSSENYNHSLSLGIDYKDYEDTLSFQDDEDDLETRITYLPLSVYYNSSLNHHAGSTRFSFGVNSVFRGLVSEQREFEDKRYKSRGNYIFASLGIERYQNLPRGFQLFAKAEGQVSDQPLPSNEQYFAGGLKSVRGYKEAEEAGDNALHGTVELSYKNLSPHFGLPDWATISPNVFYDIAVLNLEDPLPGQKQPDNMDGYGVGLRGQVSKYFEYELSWGIALDDTSRTKSGDHQFYFILKGKF